MRVGQFIFHVLIFSLFQVNFLGAISKHYISLVVNPTDNLEVAQLFKRITIANCLSGCTMFLCNQPKMPWNYLQLTKA